MGGGGGVLMRGPNLMRVSLLMIGQPTFSFISSNDV